MTHMAAKHKHRSLHHANPVRIRPEEVRVARQMLGWSRVKLARLAAVPFTELTAFERHGARLKKDSLHRLTRVLAFGGVDFVGPPTFPGLIAYRPDRVSIIVTFGVPHKRRGVRGER